MRAWLAPHRRRAMHRALERYAPEAMKLADAVVAHDPAAIARYDALLAEAVTTMREDAARGGAGAPLEALLLRLERSLYRDRPELMDDAAFPEDLRTDILERLDRFNASTGIYDTVLGVLDPLITAAERRGRAPVRVHDVAAGHGGFALHAAERLGARVAAEASDIRAEYLSLGRTQATARGVSVAFSVQDALALADLGASGVEVITCTQALHHFPPGMIARMLGEAARAARTGICFVDGERSWTVWALLAVMGTVYGRSWAFFHDSVVSARRMLYEEELSLIAALAPGLPKGRLETGSATPAHIWVRFARAQGGAS
jgi:2-polyprenyl-3-methyl-5-hydroxy-6-metoxy-1,4-benzoquinol methylase